MAKQAALNFTAQFSFILNFFTFNALIATFALAPIELPLVRNFLKLMKWSK